MSEVSKLTASARRVLELPTENDLADEIGGYTDAFEQWAQSFLSRKERQLSDAERAELVELQQLHTQVITRAQGLKEDISHGLRMLKRKGKGLLAYTDVFPKQIGSMRPRKL